MRRLKSGGGWAAIKYSLQMAHKAGWGRLYRALGSKNSCKTCALGMGGQQGGMRNEAGHFPEVCKKSIQAMVSDLQGAMPGDFFQKFALVQLERFTPRQLENSGRLVQPVYAGENDTHYRPISWEEALERLVAAFQSISPNEAFFYASGRSSNEAGFLLSLIARVWGTNYVHNCSYYCHQASGVGLNQAIGTGTATVTLEDLDECDCFILLGGNPASNHPRLMRTLMQIRRRGGQVIVINPAKELGLCRFKVPSDWRSLLFGSDIASLYVQPKIGGDIGLFTGVAKVLLQMGAVDSDFISQHTAGYNDFADQLQAASWSQLESASGVSQSVMQTLAQCYVKSSRAIFGWTMGITHHTFGVGNVRGIVNLALMRGMIGKPGAGLLPIRGHSNVQGLGSVGVSPVIKPEMLDRLEQALGVPLARSPGRDTMACMQAADAGEVKAALCLGGNLFGSNPDAAFARRALGKIQMVTYLSSTLNSGHALGRGRQTLILPVLVRDEEPQPTTQESMFSFVRLSDGGQPRHVGPRAETEILSQFASRLLPNRGTVRFAELSDHGRLRQLIADTIPALAPLAGLQESRQEFHIPGRAIHAPVFATPSGKAHFYAGEIPDLRPADNELVLMTIRSEGQFNTVVYEEEDIYRGQVQRNVILMNPKDMTRLRLTENSQVTVKSAVGEMRGILARPFDVHEGGAMMYYPEANLLVPRDVDPLSGTPAFKAAVITLQAE